MSESHDVTELAAAAFKLLLNEVEHEDTLVSVDGDGAGTEAGMTRLFLDVGRFDRVRPADIVGAIANEIGIPGRQIGSIDIYDRFAFVEVPVDLAQRVVRGLGGVTLRGKPVKVSLAKPKV
jgi:ATP-dependent RNA helicase DeaD